MNILFVSVDTIKERTGLHGNVDEKLIKPEIKAVQDTNLMPALGSELYKRLQEGIDASDLNADEETLLDDYVTDALVNMVLAEMPSGLSFQFYNKGMVKKRDENAELTSMQDIIEVANKYKARAEFYKQRLIKYLQENYELFPEYHNYREGLDVYKPTASGYKSSIFLFSRSYCKGNGNYDNEIKDETLI